MDLIINLINKFALSNLLKQGTKIWYGRRHNRDLKLIINLILTSKNLNNFIVKYIIYRIEHSSNYSIIKIVFDILTPELK